MKIPKSKRPRVKKPKAKPKALVATKQYVDRQIAKNAEDKSVQIQQQQSFGNVFESPDFNAFPMIPLTGYWVIGQNSTSGGRIGNRIRIKSVHLNYVLRPMPYDAGTNPTPVPVNVLLYLGYVKESPSQIPIAIDVDEFFQSGSSSQAPFGTLRDTVAILNKDYWVIKKAWMEKIGYANNAGTGPQAGNQYFANNDYKMNAVRRLNITSFMNKTVVFNDSIGATSRNLFFMYQAVSSTGFATPSTTKTANIDYWIDFVYEDS